MSASKSQVIRLPVGSGLMGCCVVVPVESFVSAADVENCIDAGVEDAQLQKGLSLLPANGGWHWTGTTLVSVPGGT